MLWYVLWLCICHFVNQHSYQTVDFIVTIDEIAYTSIQAVDEDDDALVYSLTSEYFSIHPSTGVIYVAKSLLDSPTGQNKYYIVSLIQYKYYIV